MAKNWSENSMAAALQGVKQGSSVRKAAQKFSVPKSTLADRASGKIAEGARWGKSTILSPTDEAEMLVLAKQRSEMGIGFTKGTFIRFAGALADKKGLTFKQGRPSEMWWRSFKSRHDSFSLRTPEPTAAARHDAMSRLRMAKYFSALKGVLEKNDFTSRPQRIWNMDETGISMSHKPNQVIAQKGTKTVHGKASNSREMITVIACGNATGEIIPPHFIVPGKTRKKLEGYDLNSVVPGSPLYGANFSVSDSGWTKEGIGRLWFTETFIPSIGQARPQLLISDGHGSHNNLEFIELARKEDIILVELPSHTSQWTQPFDRAVFKSLKSHWNSEVQNFISATGIPVGHGQFLKVFGKAWGASMTPSNIRNGFRATGICPYHPGAIPNEAFSVTSPSAPCRVESRDISQTNAVSESHTGTSVDATLSVPPEENELHADSSSTGVASVTISLPLTTDGVFDLPLMVDSEGNLVVDNPPSATDGQVENEQIVDANSVSFTGQTITKECSDEQALQVIESAIDCKQISVYQQALSSGIDLQDSMYHTWKSYKEKLVGRQKFAASSTNSESLVKTFANEVCPLPKLNTIGNPKKRTAKASSGYFVISAEEAYAKKKQAEEEKKRKLLEKEERKLQRENNKIIRLREKEKKLEMRKQKQATASFLIIHMSRVTRKKALGHCKQCRPRPAAAIHTHSLTSVCTVCSGSY